jgi:hypothetical protein
LQTSRTWSSRSHLVCSHGHTDASPGSGAIPRGYALSRQGLPRRDHKFGYRQLWRARVAECQSICTDTWGNKWTTIRPETTPSRPQQDPVVAAPDRLWSPIRTPGAKTTARLDAMLPWPVLVGVIIAILGISTGISGQVGPKCGGAFDFEQKSAAAADLTGSYPGSSTIYEATCQMLAGQLAGT